MRGPSNLLQKKLEFSNSLRVHDNLMKDNFKTETTNMPLLGAEPMGSLSSFNNRTLNPTMNQNKTIHSTLEGPGFKFQQGFDALIMGSTTLPMESKHDEPMSHAKKLPSHEPPQYKIKKREYHFQRPENSMYNQYNFTSRFTNKHISRKITQLSRKAVQSSKSRIEAGKISGCNRTVQSSDIAVDNTFGGHGPVVMARPFNSSQRAGSAYNAASIEYQSSGPTTKTPLSQMIKEDRIR